MTDGERIALAVALSLAMHWVAVRPLPASTGADTIDLGAFEVGSVAVGTSLAPPIAVESPSSGAPGSWITSTDALV